jgi:hypothetical protein
MARELLDQARRVLIDSRLRQIERVRRASPDVTPRSTVTSGQLADFLVGEERFPFQGLRTFERRRTVAEPNALQIGLAIRRRRRIPGLLTPHRHPRRDRNDDRESAPHCQRSSAHVDLCSTTGTEH